MENKSEIIRDPAALNYQLVFFSIAYFILALISIYILIVPFRYFDGNIPVWMMLFTLIAIVFYFISAAILRYTWKSLRYYFAKDCLIISSGFGGNKEDVYRYESIKGISMQQTNTQKSRGYARLVLQIDASPEPVVLKDIIKPNEILEQLQDQITIANRLTSVK